MNGIASSAVYLMQPREFFNGKISFLYGLNFKKTINV